MRARSLRARIRNGTLIMLALAVVFGAVALPEVFSLGGAIRETLYRNYVSIEAARKMHEALYTLELAGRDGKMAAALEPNRGIFLHWIDVENHDITEPGEAELAGRISESGRKLIDRLARGWTDRRFDEEFANLHAMLDQLIKINRDAMFRADSRAIGIGRRLSYEFAAGLGLLLIFGAALSWTLGWTIAKPLDELADHLRGFSLHGPVPRLGPQPLAELEPVAAEFNRMAERLERFDKLNVDRLLYEKNKTEAIIESLEDGIVLLDSGGIVAHINELASIILGVERADALGSRFDDLNSNHPHYLRVRSALAEATGAGVGFQIEVNLYVRGREHVYLLKPMPLRHSGGGSFGTILILQDITYLRDKDRARANLIATLSHELKTPLTSIGLAVQLLARKREQLDPRFREYADAIGEEILRIRQLADNLLDLARGESTAITVSDISLDLAQLINAVAKNFAIQAEQKRVTLRIENEEPALRGHGDPVKLSWALSNLIGNALRYTPEGGSIEVRASRFEGALRISVADSGPGIPAEIREHIFERFTQWTPNGFETGSAGLGLAIVREIVEAHGGRIFVDSSASGGKFTVELPIMEQS